VPDAYVRVGTVCFESNEVMEIHSPIVVGQDTRMTTRTALVT
jgi:hypothetical protein